MNESTAPGFKDPRLPGRFWAKVSVQQNGCWHWTGARYRDGYGQYSDGGRKVAAHRAAHSALVGPIADDMQLDHLCHTLDVTCPGGLSCLHRRCVNPRHTEQVTQQENNLRSGSFSALNAAKTHCPRKHAYTPENTRVRSGGRRDCLTCERERERRRAPRQRRATSGTTGGVR